MRVTEPTRSKIVGLGTWLLGLLFIAAASLKALEFNAFVQQIERYQIVPTSMAATAAGCLIVAEALLGAFCVAGFQLGKALRGMIALLAIFVVATLVRWGSLVGTNCGCFGSVATGGPGSVLLHGLVLITFAVALILLIGRGTGATPYRGFRMASGIVAAVIITFVAQPPATSLAKVQPGESVVRVFMSATCPKCRSEVGLVRELAQGQSSAPVRLFIGAETKEQIQDFVNAAGDGLEYTPLTFPQLSRETGHVPTVQFFRDGKLFKEWVGHVPTAEEFGEALSVDAGAPRGARGRADAARP